MRIMSTDLFMYRQNGLQTDGVSTEIEDESYKRMYVENIHKDLVDYKPGVPGSGGSRGVPGISHYVTRYDPVLPGLSFRLNSSARDRYFSGLYTLGNLC